MSDTNTPYAGLSPEVILDALEAHGFRPTGSLLALNSYENRVYQLELEDESYCVAKFYRPVRWSDAQILEEHAFTQELMEHELSVVGPWERDGTSLFNHQEFRFAVFPRQGGHAPNIDVSELYFKAGSMKKNARAQQNYVSSNYTHIARDMVAGGGGDSRSDSTAAAMRRARLDER